MNKSVLKHYRVTGMSRFNIERHEQVDRDTYEWYFRRSIRPETVIKNGVTYLRPGALSEGWSLERWIYTAGL